MLSQNQRTGETIIRESCGIGHEPQVVEIECREEYALQINKDY